MKVIFGRQFKIAYKQRIQSDAKLKALFEQSMALFIQNPQEPSIRTHRLHGILADHYAFSVDFDCRVIFKKISEDTILLVDIGNHDEVY